VAHVNHKTRGIENDLDHNLIKEFCLENALAFHYHELDTEISKNPNFQAVASLERYKWMDSIMNEFGYSNIATAHHKDDNVESFIMNLLRGSGLKGLSGIAPVKNQKIIRPLYYFTRKQIDHYQSTHKISFREDSSNEKDYYLRNKLRIHLLAPLKKIDANAIDQINESIHLIAEADTLLQSYIEGDNSISENSTDGLILKLSEILKKPSPSTILWYKLYPFGFNKYDIQDILHCSRNGAFFLSKTHTATLSRGLLYIKKTYNSSINDTYIGIDRDGEYIINTSVKLQFQQIETLELTKDKDVEYLGFDENPYPLIVRTRQIGDYFFPIGLKGSKKLKDFIVDLKLNIVDKENLLILQKNGDIAYVIPYRISEKYKVNAKTKYILRITHSRV
jgi:tRNA(Ile)-lysidine synthase